MHRNEIRRGRSVRTPQQIRRHYEVERSIAKRLKSSDRDSRAQIYRTMYDELFAEVPDHSRRVERHDPARARFRISKNLALVKPFLGKNMKFVEFGPGNCQFALEVTKYVDQVFAVDISYQSEAFEPPENFQFVLYNGFDLEIPDGTIDVIFSDQLVEHIHPDDTELHFKLARRLLRPTGVYLFVTPHAMTGPHDISRRFSETAEGFHLKEWTYDELAPLVRRCGFSSIATYWFARGKVVRLPLWAMTGPEKFFHGYPLKMRRRYLPYLLPRITMAAFA